VNDINVNNEDSSSRKSSDYNRSSSQGSFNSQIYSSEERSGSFNSKEDSSSEDYYREKERSRKQK